jgi:TRAP-type C4-dicarboxylate transport system permease small subunit
MEFLQIVGFFILIALMLTNAGVLLFGSVIISTILWDMGCKQMANTLDINSKISYMILVIAITYSLYKIIDKKVKNKNISSFA